jgi:hypothetical protein
LLAAGPLALVASCASGPPAADPARIQAAALGSHIQTLADDRMEGRGTGTPGYRLAADYVAAQFESAGLEPAGAGGGFLQPVPLREGRLVRAGSGVWLIRGGKVRELAFERDFVMRADLSRPESEVTAPLVFAGYGITAPELDHDDYAGLDVRGAIVVLLSGAPPAFPVNQRAWYSHSRVKNENAVGRGAVGILTVRTPVDEARSTWERSVLGSTFPSMTWLAADGTPHREYPELRGSASLSRAGARALFEGATRSLETVFEDIERGTVHGFPLPGEARIRRVTRHAAIESPNVVGVLRGSDPALRDEYVVYSAHLDHLGVGKPVNGDSIYNGAFDNATGCAALIEVARAMAAGPPPRRSVLFVAVTGEEKGLQGAEYFAENPTVPQGSMVANINMDMFLLLHPAHDVVATGIEHSTLDGPARRAAERLNLELAPDPIPEEVVFVRSDQLCFMRTGIPALFVRSGQTSGDSTVDGRALARAWRLERYHMPSDDLHQPMDMEACAQYARMNYLVGWDVANADGRPMWKAGDFFGGKFGGPMETP